MTAAYPHHRRLAEQALRRPATIVAALLVWFAAPYAWQRTAARALEYGVAIGPAWPLLTLALWLAAIGLMYRLSSRPAGARRRRSVLAAALVAWVAIQLLLWRVVASPLGAEASVGWAMAASTLWLFWSWAMFLEPIRELPLPLGEGRGEGSVDEAIPQHPNPLPKGEGTSPLGQFSDRLLVRRGAVLVGLLLLAGAAIACLRSDGMDGAGRPIVGWQFFPAVETTALAASVSVSDRSTSLKAVVDSPSCPCFRGADGLGVATGVQLRADWSAFPPRLAWRRAVGAGWGGFAVDGGQLFTQEQRGQMETVACYDLATGREQWSHADSECFRSAATGDGPRATPAVAGDSVYSLGATGLLNCLDRQTGKRRWSVDVLADNDAGNLMHGLSGSPLVVDRWVIVSAGGGQGKSLVAYDRDTGRRVWRAGSDPAGYGSPLLCTLAGRRQIVILNRPGLAAHDVETGRVLWTYAWPNSTETNCSQPAPYGEKRLFVSSGYGKGCSLLEVDRREAGEWQVRCLWATRSLKTKFASAVLYEGHAYGLDDGILCCVDLADGGRRWKAGRYGHGQVLLAGDKLIVQAESGEAALVAADPAEHRELGRFAALAGKTWNYPALAGCWLLCRNDREAACYELSLCNE
ncbi:MAG TPA: PQQ-binding-like beta-propeller repeat protein [Pirellulales bacterium]|nr:PQQ-binding-like beta-propeller repeat protein [Pirellulales bacterium]